MRPNAITGRAYFHSRLSEISDTAFSDYQGDAAREAVGALKRSLVETIRADSPENRATLAAAASNTEKLVPPVPNGFATSLVAIAKELLAGDVIDD